MKSYYKQPTKEVRIVRPDRNEEVWEFWILVPQRIGGAQRRGTRRILSENDGKEYPALVDILIDDLNSAGHKDVASELQAPAPKVVKVNGLDLVASGRWPVFASMRKLDPKDVAAMQQTFVLTPAEAKQLEIDA